MLISIPLIGPWLGFTLFGGEFPGTAIIRRLFVLHILIIPVAIAGLLGTLRRWVAPDPTQFGDGRRREPFVGSFLWPSPRAS